MYIIILCMQCDCNVTVVYLPPQWPQSQWRELAAEYAYLAYFLHRPWQMATYVLLSQGEVFECTPL